MKGALIKAGLVLGLGLAVVAPTVASAASPTSLTQSAGSTRVSGAHRVRIDAIAKALSITPQQVRTAIREGALKELASVSHMTTAQVKEKLKSLAPGKDIRISMERRIGRAGVAVGLKAVAGQLQMTPQALSTAIRQRNLTLPSGTSVQSLQGTAQTAVQTWLQGRAAKHPKLSAQRQQAVTQRVGTVIGKLLTRATTSASTNAAPTSPSPTN
ncbi:MAG: hypothetical protein M0Z66_14930 [Thermaerobacter sp.]|nr:hypothetical protein [Thermaerobacter sp.]